MKHSLLIISLFTLTSSIASALTPQQMNGRACNNLLGPVKSVTVDDWTQLYNRNGQFLGWNRESIKYTTTTSYTEDGSRYKIRYTATTRTDQQPTGERFKKVYTFDSKGRIIKVYSNVEFFVQEETHYYKGNDRFPYRTVTSSSEGGFDRETDYQFEYLEFDSHGNWIKCHVTGIEMEEDHDDASTENVDSILTRTIKYY